MTAIRPVDDVNHHRRRGVVAPSGDIAAPPAGSASRNSVEARREVLEQLQVMEVHLQTAGLLVIRADASSNATFAAVLRDRAVEHRRRADRVRENLATRGFVPHRLGARRPAS